MDNINKSAILNVLSSNPKLVSQVLNAAKGKTFTIGGKTYTAQELSNIIQTSLSGNKKHENMGLVVEHTSSRTEFNTSKSKKNTPSTSYNKFGLDNKYGKSVQIKQSNCYLIAAINTIRNAETNQESLRSLRTEKTINGKKIYTFNFPGAKIAAEALKKDNLKGGIFITGTYSFNEDEVRSILSKAGKQYSKGDPDTILLEAAFEKYRKEVEKTCQANNIDPKKNTMLAGVYTGSNSKNILEGGFGHDAIFILTGKKSQLYTNNDAQMISRIDLSNGIIKEVSTNSLFAIREVSGFVKRTQKQLNRMLNKMQKDFEKDGKLDSYCIAGFITGDNFGHKAGHALTIKRVTSDKITLIDPRHPEKDITISREQFLRLASYVSFADNRETFFDRIKNFSKMAAESFGF